MSPTQKKALLSLLETGTFPAEIKDLDAYPKKLTMAEQAWLDLMRPRLSQAEFRTSWAKSDGQADPSKVPTDPYEVAKNQALQAQAIEAVRAHTEAFLNRAMDVALPEHLRDPRHLPEVTFTLPVAVQKVEVTARIENPETDRARANRLADRCQALEDENRTLHAENSRLRRGLK